MWAWGLRDLRGFPGRRRIRIGDLNCGDVAQLGEHLLCKQGVVGSIPIVSTMMVPGPNVDGPIGASGEPAHQNPDGVSNPEGVFGLTGCVCRLVFRSERLYRSEVYKSAGLPGAGRDVWLWCWSSVGAVPHQGVWCGVCSLEV